MNDSGLDLDDQGSSTVTNSSLDDNNTSHSKGKGKKSNAGNTTSAQYLGPGKLYILFLKRNWSLFLTF